MSQAMKGGKYASFPSAIKIKRTSLQEIKPAILEQYLCMNIDYVL